MTETQPSNQELSLAAGVFTVFLCMIFGSNAVAVKLAFSGMGVFTTASIRFAIAASVIFLWARFTGRTIALKKGQIHQVLVFSALFTVQLSLFYLGLSKSNASRGALLSNLLPFFILFLAHFFIPGDRITRRKFFGILLGFGGVVFMFMEKKGVAAGFRTGDLIILLAVIIWSSSTVYLKRIISTFMPFQVVLYSTLFSVPIFFLEALLWDGTMVTRLDAAGCRVSALPEPDFGIFRFCSLEHHAQKIRGGIIAFVCVYHAHCRRCHGGTGFRRADYSQDFAGPCFHRVRNFSGSLASQKGSTGISDKTGNLIGHPMK